ncbi:MAG TPA: hypothetical protein VFB42_08500 [Gaiellaceae bacterium]|nr:hypothetical protein [Gaiellaceae bacterium]
MGVGHDVFVLRRVAPGRFVHLGGSGRGESWAGIVEADLEEDAAVAEALKTSRPLRVEHEGSARVFGPYYARSAAIVPVSQDAVVVFGSPDGRVEAGDGELAAAAAAANGAIAADAPAKRLADELELLEAVRAAAAVAPLPVAAAIESLAAVAVDALSCELGLVYLADGDRLGVVERGWTLAVPREDALVSLRNVLGGAAFPFCVQDAHTAPPPGALAGDRGIRSYYLLELTGLARGVLLVAHTDAAPRGFTLLCRQLGARVAQVASAVLGLGLTREWTAAEAARVEEALGELERRA